MIEIFRKVGFFMLGILSLLYIIFSRNFAKMYAQITFLDFPIFTGEILLFVCLILSFFIFDSRSIKGQQWWVVFYFLCVTTKALWGYGLWGPLAFRHAALFYYPIFIFFGFIFYKKVFLSEPLKFFIVILSLVLCTTNHFNEYWILALWIIVFILMRSFSNKTIKYFFYICLAAVVFISYNFFILTARTFIVGNIAAAVFLITALLLIAKIKSSYKGVIAGVLFILLVFFIYKYSSLNASGTILDMKTIINQYRLSEAELKLRQPDYVPKEFSDAKLFNPGEPASFNEPKKDLNKNAIIKRYKMLASEMKTRGSYHVSRGQEIIKPSNPEQSFTPFDPAGNKISKQEIFEKKRIDNDKTIRKGRIAEDAYGNILFRLFIWRDMLFEFSRSWPILGFSFGKPFRSESLEILNWANGDWMRDGWIEPHNSYLNILYRMGILGVALISFLIWKLCSIIKSFIAFKSLSGILLSSILINWLVATNFLPLFELPYNAIPFWALWGVTLGYLKEIEVKRQIL
ncbi:MAG: O-antigen ligase family protein [Candidatus Omnitrophota bacterium]|nr:O-antigen ligase family protein [Candidatus Omnitrophota bacterium]